MDMQLKPEDEAFRQEVRAFLDEHLDAELREAGEKTSGISSAHVPLMRWHKILHAKGWVAPGWPQEFGGTGWSDMQRYIWQSECACANTPKLYPMGLGMIGPTLIACGTKQQQEYYLPRLLSGAHIWCQGYSEPGSGSDLASLQCAAVRDGDDYIINGSKIWTSYAQHANHIFCLVRTDKTTKPQAGISFLLIEMDSPGISVEPIITLAQDHEVNQVFFDNVRVPVANRVGAENDGWSVAKTLLTFERSSAYAARLKLMLGNLETLVADSGDAALAQRHAALSIRVAAVEMTEFRVQAALADGRPNSSGSSQLKIMGTEAQQDIDRLAVDALGARAAVWQPERREMGANVAAIGPEATQGILADFLNNRAASIYGGSNEVQRNILAKMALGL
ncbi:acyl-CoA dehydrogenase family protein [Alphaproteobacteria bacterium]|nr:acyl-CoA dehydrogenase family protein [Alphaproteobacteria bacterium]MDB2381240.1 acyl-CoA dehydrogenase family protein [Alphaproteobacteria bacterium]MDB2406659.1 acyl-CoA dehydrogenase family protein [Alphaproteobacteria bacterium]MDB2477548.1 acyl-CoA dehydrogenase family protein [Alphaproteobacteria bacterium]MDB2541167.1 acyl-CoA dehydrogenase family protein [Alphaproteobacteria bacterium]